MYNTYQVIDYSKDSEFWTSKEKDKDSGFYEKYEKYIEC